MEVLPYKDPDLIVQPLLKMVKTQYDSPSLKRRYKLMIQRHLFLDQDYDDITWHGEAYHWLGLVLKSEGDFDGAIQFFTKALTKFAPNEYLASARARREIGLLFAETGNFEAAFDEIQKALELHDADFKNLKGRRHRRITESYEWRVQLLADSENAFARDSLITYALSGCRDCCTRDQHETIEFALLYAEGVQKQLLEARLIEIYARRYKLVTAASSTVKFVIDAEVSVARHILGTFFRKE